MDKYKYNFIILSITVFCFIFISDTFSQGPPVIWNKTYNNAYNKDDMGYACVTDAAGFLYITGFTSNNSSSGNHDIITIKYNQATGDTVWTRIYNGPADKDDEGFACCMANDGNLFVAGFSDAVGAPQTNDRLIIIKYNSSNGSIIWTKTNGAPASNQHGYSCAIDGGNLYIAGIFNNGSEYMKIWKLNSTGDTIWTRLYNSGNEDAEAHGCAVDNNGNLYVSGYSLENTLYKITLIKYNSSGTMQWIKYCASLDDPSSHYMTGVAVQGSSIFITGLGGNSANRYGVTAKYTAAGDTVWVKRNDSPSIYDQNHKCKADANGDVYVSGTRYNGTNDDWVMLKYKGTDGTLMWTVVFNHPTNNSDYAIDCALDNSGGLYIAGFVNLNSGNTDIYTVKYQSTIGIKNISSEIPSSFSLSQNYPNPFNPSTKIRFSLPQINSPHMGGKGGVIVKLKIYDVLGKEAATLVNVELQPGTYEVEWNASDFPSGIYFYKLQTEVYTETRKMVFVK